ncbi:hypothetical protein [Pseudomonas sp. HLS-6]|uniref:hypothetical protein n=1 Tax=Pseudomonas sp. HLS-6 TaxID=2049589 RepID=UPI002113F6C9|nr:hypothetical protein [Pseudomonas sp. HLS-6]
MLDSFERLKCLYDSRFNANDLMHYLQDIEEFIYRSKAELPDEIDTNIRLGEPLFAAGNNAEAVVTEFFDDVVTLARPKGTPRNASFRYTSTPKLRDNVFQIMRQKMHMAASAIIQEDRFRLRMRSGNVIDVDTPLLSASAAGSIVSAWYKSPLVVEKNILQASSDLMIVASNSDRKASMSILVPDEESGMDTIEYRRVNDAIHRQLDRLRHSGVEVIEAGSTDALANDTIKWWEGRVA